MRVLFVGAHTDDEVSSAGTLTKLSEKGHEIFVAVFSFCEESCEALGFSKDILDGEFANSMEFLKLDSKHVFRHHYRVRHFLRSRQEILEVLIVIRKLVQPHLVFVPSTLDMHQDHQVISVEGRRAFFKGCSLLGYEFLKAPFSEHHICYSRLNLNHLQTKMNCLLCYKSQAVRPDMNPEVKKSFAALRGWQAGVKYAEAFEVIRWIM